MSKKYGSKKNRRDNLQNRKKYDGGTKEYSVKEYMNYDYESYSDNSTHKNVLLFCISILPNGNAIYSSYGDNEGFECKGILSVEPGTKYVFHKLECKKDLTE